MNKTPVTGPLMMVWGQDEEQADESEHGEKYIRFGADRPIWGNIGSHIRVSGPFDSFQDF